MDRQTLIDTIRRKQSFLGRAGPDPARILPIWGQVPRRRWRSTARSSRPQQTSRLHTPNVAFYEALGATDGTLRRP